MRMWMVDPKKMCRKHLLGEHVEIHMMVGTLLKGRSIDGFLGTRSARTAERPHSPRCLWPPRCRPAATTHRSPLPQFPRYKMSSSAV